MMLNGVRDGPRQAVVAPHVITAALWMLGLVPTWLLLSIADGDGVPFGHLDLERLQRHMGWCWRASQSRGQQCAAQACAGARME
jgi:hypothetical protein